MAGRHYVMANAPTAITNNAWVIAQLTCGATQPLTVHQFRLQTNVLTSAQTVVTVQVGTYATGSAVGAIQTATLKPIETWNTIAASATPYGMTTTLGTTFTCINAFQWNLALPWEDTRGLQPSKYEVQATKCWAVILPSPAGTPTLSGTVLIEEY